MITVVTGGARSGKSSHVVRLGMRHPGPVVFVATAPVLDDDMETRIARHRAERPDWPTVEEPHDFSATITSASGDTMVIVDCITLWVSNLLRRGDYDEEVATTASQLAENARTSPAHIVLVTNEVGLGVHPETELGRRYRDLLGRVNQILVAQADRALFMVSGRVLLLSDPGGDSEKGSP
ncbi:MAG: bifunctional adenosylcobinamide kinase/adenosylcobinamide-phosphate guanylyltransferase [Actinobacteria bacterium]|nr:bifunctional adenosylcobinamide kinase/adenosylcobinamide-phosphate guanylyltransferase [Actinomycetota bacterium]